MLVNDPFNAYYQHKVKEIRNQLLGSIDQPKPATANHDQRNQQRAGNVSNDDDNYQEDRNDADNNFNQHSDNNEQHRQMQKENDTSINQNQQSERNETESFQNDHNTHPDGAPKVRMKLNEYIQEMTMKLEEPPPLNFLATSAPSLTHMDCDIIKLTAQFIATHGRSFLLDLVGREQNNSTFDFLKPQHGQFSYMTNLIMQYALVQNQPLDILEQLSKDASSQKSLLYKMKMRAEWNRMLELEQKKREEAEEKERILYSQIDWHDFVIVETIDYQPDERGEYPPTTADQVGTRLLLQQRYEEQNVPEEMEIDMDVESDEDDGDKVIQENSNNRFAVPADLLPPQLDKVVIRRDYDPKMSSKVSAQQDNYFVSPITNERIPVDKIHDHVKYNLSDPRYLEKKDQMLQEKINEEAVFASGSQIQNSLKNLAERRTDIFGMNDKETAIGKTIDEDKPT